MKCLHIQLQPELSTGDLSKHVDSLIEIATTQCPDAEINVEHGDDDGKYINLNIFVAEIPELWGVIRRVIDASPTLLASAIVCCEGKNGWEDSLLLYHFDQNEPLDSFS